jgi:ArsR family transcriptional regulator, lead/cadmium/zinc/bismuth-responsive transcriptional repressor
VCDLAWDAERSENPRLPPHARAHSAGLARSRRDGKTVMYAVAEAGRALIDAVREPETAAR